MNKPTTILILAGGSLKDKFDFIKLNSLCPALLPINCKSISSYILSFYSALDNCKIYVAIDEIYRDQMLSELEAIDCKFDFIFMPATESVIGSLEYCLSKIEKSTSILVNLVTSIPTSFAEVGEIQFYKNEVSSSQWSGIYENDGKIQIILKSKNNISQPPFHAFTGIFHLTMVDLYSLLNKDSVIENDLFSLFDNEHLYKYNIKMGEWLDCGHEINYYETKAKLISSRSFNKISFIDRGIIRKKSSNIVKLKEEAEYYTLLPKDVSIFYPRLIKLFKEEDGQGVYDLEFYGYPNIAELIIYWDLSYDILNRMFDHFNLVLQKFKQYSFHISQKHFVDFYQTKLYKRVNEYMDSLSKADFDYLNSELIVNGKPCKTFNSLKKFIEHKIYLLYNEEDFCIIHGDFCYNNILYDIPSGIVRLIDPRGSFGESEIGIYGDRKYDIAKLAHSAIGGYDFFVNNNYTVKKELTCYNYTFGNSKLEVTSFLMEQLIEKNGYKFEDIKFIMGTLFLSMCPLHRDSPKRQMTFFLHGLKIINEVYDSQLN